MCITHQGKIDGGERIWFFVRTDCTIKYHDALRQWISFAVTASQVQAIPD